MLRFLRKNEKLAKWTLVIGMTLLLVSWLVADGSTQLLRFIALSGTTWATVDNGQKVTLGDLEEVQKEMRLLDALKDQYIDTIGANKDPAQWFLISREAEQAGLVGGPGDGLRAIASIAAQQKVPEGVIIGALAGQSGLTGNETLETMGKVVGVKRLITLTSGSPPISDARLKQRAAEMLMGVSGSAVVIDARNAASAAVPPADEARLTAHLKEHGEKPAPADKKGFGYRLDDRVQIEWMEISTQAIRTGIESSGALSEIALRKYWHEHPEEFATSALGSQAPTYDSMRDSVRSKLLDSLVAAKMAEIAKFAADSLQMSLRGIPQKDGGFDLPADWETRNIPLARLGAEIAQKFSVPEPTPAAIADRWITPTEVDAIPGLGSASTQKLGRTPVKASQLAVACREFGGQATLPSQARVAAPVLFDAASGSIFIFRVTAAEKSRSPASLDEAREAVTADVAAIDRFAALVNDLPRIKVIAAEQGIESLASTYGSTVQPATDLREADPRLLAYGVTIGSPIPGLGSDADALRKIVHTAMALPVGAQVASLPLADRTVVIDDPARLMVLVFQINGLTPMTREDYARLAPSGGLSAASEQSSLENVDPKEAFSFKALAARHSFKFAREDAADTDAKVN